MEILKHGGWFSNSFLGVSTAKSSVVDPEIWTFKREDMGSLIFRHSLVGSFGAFLTLLFWLSRPEWVAEMRFWRAVGDASLILLYITLALGPVSRFLPRFWLLLPYRRELGIWFGISAIVHTVIILDGWVSWDVSQFMGYQFVPQLGRMVRLESGFGMANLLGLLAVLFTLPLMATSADWALRGLGGASWKFLHYGAYTIFYLVVLHTAYFLYIHYTASFHRTPPDEANWFQIPFAILTLAVITLQVGAYFKTVRRQRSGARRRAENPNSSTRQSGLETDGGFE